MWNNRQCREKNYKKKITFNFQRRVSLIFLSIFFFFFIQRTNDINNREKGDKSKLKYNKKEGNFKKLKQYRSEISGEKIQYLEGLNPISPCQDLIAWPH